MKKILLLVIASFICGNAMAQISPLKKRTLIGEIKNDKVDFVVDTKSLLNAINEEFSDGFDHLEIKAGETTGERTEKFYYLDITSGSTGKKMVRWLKNKNGKLYMVNTWSEKNQYMSYFATCRGTENCDPTLYVDKDNIAWVCADKPVSTAGEQARLTPTPCEISITMITLF